MSNVDEAAFEGFISDWLVDSGGYDALKVGKSITIEGYPRKDGTPEIRAEWIEIGGTPALPAPGAAAPVAAAATASAETS